VREGLWNWLSLITPLLPDREAGPRVASKMVLHASGDALIPETGYVSIEFENGDTYVGELRKMKPHGVGTLHYRDGTLYKGEFRKGLKHGLGVTQFPHGDKHVGRYESNVFCGRGTYINSEGGFKYVGQFKDGQFDGPAVVYYSAGVKFIGHFSMGQRTKGEYVYPQDDTWSSLGSPMSSSVSTTPNGPMSPRTQEPMSPRLSDSVISSVEDSFEFLPESSWIRKSCRRLPLDSLKPRPEGMITSSSLRVLSETSWIRPDSHPLTFVESDHSEEDP